MLKANAVFNIFAGVFDVRNCVFRVLNYVRQNIAVVFDALAFDSLCFDYVLANTLSCSTFCYANCDSIIRCEFCSTITHWVVLERFSNECRKTKTKVITPANHNRHKLPNEPIRTRSKYM